MNYIIYKSEERGKADFGWFAARYSFSFGQYHDPNKMGFGKLRVLNDSIIQPGKGFSEHPHDNFEIVTIQFQGDLEHTDISGTRHIRANDVQAISAGTGVTHSDVNISQDEALQFQIWIEPNKLDVKPASNISHFNPNDWEEKWKLLVGPKSNIEAPLQIQQDAFLSRGKFSKGNHTSYRVKKEGNGVFIMLISGSCTINKETINKRDAIGITEAKTIGIQIQQDSDILIIEVPM